MIPEKERRERYVLFIAKTKEAPCASLVECVAKRRLCHAVVQSIYRNVSFFCLKQASPPTDYFSLILNALRGITLIMDIAKSPLRARDTVR